ncbi:MAG: phosphatase PAP2 family protein [Deltaproteobacteria bacterium]|nr:phosphatase PAP2 family protein [Deltaproteobacteria bacterium]
MVSALGLAALVASLDRWVPLDDAIWRGVVLARGCGADVLVERAVDAATHGLAILLAIVLVLHVRAAGARSAWPWLATWILGLLASKTLKHVFTRDRPSALPDLTVGYSFPSAHVMNGLLAALAVVALAWRFRHRARWCGAATAAAATVIAGRVLLGRHWATDALGGVLAAGILAGLARPAIARRPVAAPLVLGAVAAAALGLDQRLGERAFRLPSPLVARRAALVDVDVGPEMPTPRRGGWREAGLERPFGSYLWLEGEASLVLTVDPGDAAAASAAMLVFAARPEKVRGSCLRLDVALNGRAIASFVPFVGWREYRLRMPPGVLRAGDNELAFAVRRSTGTARFAVTYARLAGAPSAAEEAPRDGDAREARREAPEQGQADVRERANPERVLEAHHRLVIERRVGREPAEEPGRQHDAERGVDRVGDGAGIGDRRDEERSEHVDGDRAVGKVGAEQHRETARQREPSAGAGGAGRANEHELPHGGSSIRATSARAAPAAPPRAAARTRRSPSPFEGRCSLTSGRDWPAREGLAPSRRMDRAPAPACAPRALIVAPDASERRPVAEILSRRGWRVREVETSVQARDALATEPFDLVVPVGDGLRAGDGDLVADAKAIDEATAVVAVVASPERGREALAAGAYDVFTTPVDAERLAAIVDHVSETAWLRERSAVLDRLMNGGAHLGTLRTRDPRMIGVIGAIRRLGRYRAPVMIVGERGTEHEDAARALHAVGRAETPFVPVAARTLAVAELRRRQDAADGGMLFIDDVTALAADVAAALADILEEAAVGARAQRALRVVVGYPHPTPPSMDASDLRSPLYRRFETVLALPPLRERHGDAVLVARELAAGIGRDRGRTLGLAKPVEEALRAYRWPGNLDELETVVTAAATTASGSVIELHDLPAPLGAPAGGAPPAGTTRTLRDLEIQHLRQVLRETQGNKAQAARILGLSRWALQRRLRKHGVSPEDDPVRQTPAADEA